MRWCFAHLHCYWSCDRGVLTLDKLRLDCGGVDAFVVKELLHILSYLHVLRQVEAADVRRGYYSISSELQQNQDSAVVWYRLHLPQARPFGMTGRNLSHRLNLRCVTCQTWNSWTARTPSVFSRSLIFSLSTSMPVGTVCSRISADSISSGHTPWKLNFSCLVKDSLFISCFCKSWNDRKQCHQGKNR